MQKSIAVVEDRENKIRARLVEMEIRIGQLNLEKASSKEG
jgi:hypothetical protein